MKTNILLSIAHYFLLYGVKILSCFCFFSRSYNFTIYRNFFKYFYGSVSLSLPTRVYSVLTPPVDDVGCIEIAFWFLCMSNHSAALFSFVSTLYRLLFLLEYGKHVSILFWDDYWNRPISKIEMTCTSVFPLRSAIPDKKYLL